MQHKFELQIKDLWQALECPSKDRSVMGTAVHGLRRFTPELMRDSVKVLQVLEFVEAQRSSEGSGRQVIEQHLMEVLRSLAWNCAGWLEEAKCPRVTGFDMTGTAPKEFHPMLHVLRDLNDFALRCFEFKRPRDSFGGTRRGLVFEILGHIGRMVDLPEVVAIARQSLKKTKSVEAAQSADFLQQYFTEQKRSLEDGMVGELLSLAKAADSRSTVFSALNALVETGEIDEFEALGHMDDWKTKHR